MQQSEKNTMNILRGQEYYIQYIGAQNTVNMLRSQSLGNETIVTELSCRFELQETILVLTLSKTCSMQQSFTVKEL